MQSGEHCYSKENMFCSHAGVSRRILRLLLLLLSPVTRNGLWGNLLLLDEEVDKGLHRLHLLVSNQFVVLGDSDEVDEAHIQHLMAVDVPEGVKPVSMVQMRVAAEHLLHDTLAVLVEGLGEAAGLSNPVIAIRGVTNGGARDTSNWVRREHDGVMDLADNPLLNSVDKLGGGDLGCTSVH